MGKSIKPTYSIEFSIGILIAIFAISYFLSHQIFDVPIHKLHKNTNVYFGMCLVATAVVVMVIITWEELLFTIKIKEVEGGMIFRNYQSKLLIQLLIYCSIPAIFAYIYFNYDIRPIRFFVWAAICLVAPVIEKIVSGINNYNDFLLLTDKEIEYKNNEKEGVFNIENIQNITIIKDDRNIIEKIQLLLTNNDNVTIDLDEMELDAYYDFINKYITTHYTLLLK